jgi:hypothetical protein
MFFQRKGKLRKEFVEHLAYHIVRVKDDWMKQKQLVERCVEPSEEVLYHLKVAEAKYFLLLREARNRNVSMHQLKR